MRYPTPQDWEQDRDKEQDRQAHLKKTQWPGQTDEFAEQMASAAAPPRIADDFTGNNDNTNAKQSAASLSAASLIIEIALERYHFGVTEEGQPYAVKPGRHVVRLLRGGKNSLRAELSQAFYQKHKKAAPQQALADALLVLEGQAQEQDPDRVHLRVAAANDSVWLDLGDAAETVIQINGLGWQIATDGVPVLFRRTGLTGAMPQPGGDVGDVGDTDSYLPLETMNLLWEHLNVSEQDRLLVLAWLIAAIIEPDTVAPRLTASSSAICTLWPILD